jgi:hydroxyacid-oxoacid transhydrogenase
MKETRGPRESAVELATSNIRFGSGVTQEIGFDLADRGINKVLLLTDAHLRALPPVETALASLDAADIHATVFDGVQVEPTDQSFMDAIRMADKVGPEAFVAIGGGSVIDTAKAANLYSTYPAEFLEYVNPPIGKGVPVPGPLKPLFAVPTTAGTGSETTGVAIFDLEHMHAKTGIADRGLKPTLGLLDPDNTRTLPRAVAASTGLDVLSHAVESYTAMDYRKRPAPARPKFRPAYQGANPISDLWALEALRMVRAYLPRAVENPSDDEARGMMLLAASYAGIGFGNAGVHLPHGMSYPVSGMIRDFRMPGYPTRHAMVPHGISVILNAPAVFRFTAPANPRRHLEAAAALGKDVEGISSQDAGDALADAIISFMRRLGTPSGLEELGYTDADIPELVRGTLPQHRVTKLSPRAFSERDLALMFRDALRHW